MTKREALNGKPYAGNPHVRFDEGEAASTATSRRGSLLYKLLNFVKLTSVMLCLSASADLAPRQANAPVYSVENMVCSTNGLTVPVPQNMARIVDQGLLDRFYLLENVPGQKILSVFSPKNQFEKDDFFNGLTCYGVLSIFDSLKNVKLSDADFKKQNLTELINRKFSNNNQVDINSSSVH